MKPMNPVESALRQVSKGLMARWGKQRSYRPEQVAEAAGAVQGPAGWLIYAHALFCTKPDFDAHYQSQPSAFDYEGLRAELATRFWKDVDVTDPNADAAVIMMMMG